MKNFRSGAQKSSYYLPTSVASHTFHEELEFLLYLREGELHENPVHSRVAVELANGV